jgi:CheY-like chemotaxis protein
MTMCGGQVDVMPVRRGRWGHAKASSGWRCVAWRSPDWAARAGVSFSAGSVSGTRRVGGGRGRAPHQCPASVSRADALSAARSELACYYSAPGQRVILRGRLEEGALKLQVEDRGIGVAPDELPRVFGMFAQAAPALDRAEGGLGIGLWLSRRLVELQGGSIDAASALAELLRMLGCIVDTAFDGPRALQRAEALAPDVVLLDIGLPQMNGYEVCQRLRARHGAALRIVAMTGWGQEEDRRRSREAGFHLHLVKPVDPAALVDALNAQASTARPAAAAKADPRSARQRVAGRLGATCALRPSGPRPSDCTSCCAMCCTPAGRGSWASPFRRQCLCRGGRERMSC